MKQEIRLLFTTNTARLIWITLLLSLFGGVLGCKAHTTGLQESQARGDEAAVIAAMRTVAMAQQVYSITNEGGYATFEQLTEGGFLDERFASENPELHGYVMTMTVGDKTFKCNADPTDSGELKGRHFYLDSTSKLVRVNPTQPASEKDEIVKF